MFHNRLGFLVFFVLVFFAGSLFSQERQSVQLYKFPNNLISNVTSISKDNKNFLWLSTQDGVYRFDSKNFLKIEIIDRSTNKTGWSAIRKLCYNHKKNELLAISPDKGVAMLNNTGDTAYFEPLDLPDGLYPADIYTVDAANEKYILSTVKGTFFIEIRSMADKKTHRIEISGKPLPILPLIVRKTDEENYLIIDKEWNLRRFVITNDNSLKQVLKISLAEKINKGTEFFSIDYNKGSYYIGTSNGLIVITQKAQVFVYEKFLKEQVVYFVKYATNNICWIAASKGLYKMDGHGTLTSISNNTTNLTDNWLDNVYTIYPDNKNNIWLGTQDGVAMMEDIPAEVFSITNTYDNNRTLNHVYHLGVYDNDELIISSENGLYKYDGNHLLHTITEGNTFFLAFPGPYNHSMVSDLTTTYVLQNKKLVNYTAVFPEFTSYKDLSFNDYVYYKDSLLFLSTENIRGVFLWNYVQKKVTPITYEHDREIEQTNGMYKTGDTLFILTDSTIIEYDIPRKILKRKTIHNNNSNLNYGLFFDIVKIKNHFYIASYGNGILVTDLSFKVEQVINESNGLSNNSIYCILPVKDSILYISTNNGINVLDLHSGDIFFLNSEDGLHGNVFEEFSSLENKGKLYFGGKGGVTIIDPQKISRKDRSQNLVFLNYKIVTHDKTSEVSLLEHTKIIIPNTATQTTINFQDIVYPFSNKIKYAYKVDELHNDWIKLNVQNFVTLIGVPPGAYHLHVKASNENGNWSDQIELTLIFRPKWYQTWWFKLFVVAILLTCIYLLYRMRINQFKKEKKIRSKLASDLHDDLGSTMNSVKVYANLAIMEKQADKYLPLIKDGTQEAITGIRDIIWVLDDRKDTIEDLLSRINTFASPICDANAARYKQEVSDNARDHKLGQEERRNLYMMMKEAINNAIKYSGCKNITVNISVTKGKPSIEIKDDGKGFDTTKTSEGNGVKNMHRRAKEIKYKVAINSSEGNGTSILFQKI